MDSIPEQEDGGGSEKNFGQAEMYEELFYCKSLNLFRGDVMKEVCRKLGIAGIFLSLQIFSFII